MKQCYTSCWNANLHLSKGKDHLHHLHPTLQFHSSAATRTCDAAVKKSKPRKADKKPGTWEKIQDPQLPKSTTFMKADGFNKIWWVKSLVNPPLSIETPPLRNQNLCVFLMLKWISYVTSTHLPVFESQKSKGPSPRVLYHFQKCILTTWHINNQWRITFCLVIEGCNIAHTSPILFLEGHQSLHYHHSNFSTSKDLFSKKAKTKTTFWGAPAVQKTTKFIYIYIKNGLNSIIPQLICSL